MRENPGEILETDIVKVSMDGNRYLPLGKDVFDNADTFLHFNTDSYTNLFQRLSHYRLFFWDMHFTDKNMAELPKNIWHDVRNSLVLYSEFGDKVGSGNGPDGKSEALAVCGFEICQVDHEVLPNREIPPASGYIIDIGQLQTTLFADEREMMRYLGFIKYQDLFAHLLEQYALLMKEQRNIPVDFISVRKEMELDELRASRHISRAIMHGRNGPTDVDEEKRRIVYQREKWAQSRGYNRHLMLEDIYGSNHHSSFAKSTDEIIPDIRFQNQIAEMVR